MTADETGEDVRTPRATLKLRRFAYALILIALGAAAHSILASRTKSPTFDEPVHLFSSWLIVNHGDFRVNPEHPPLWKVVAGVPLVGTNVDIDLDSDAARSVFDQIEHQGKLATDTLFRRNAEGVALLARARVAMSIFLALTILTAARWAWTADGPRAAIIASLLLALDPNFLAHGALVTNDVAASFIFVLAGYLTWRLGRRWTWKTAALLGLTCAVGATIKFTCVLLVPIVGVPLIVRAIAKTPWPATHQMLMQSRGLRIGLVFGLAIGTSIACLAVIWSTYLFRAAPSPGGQTFDADYPRKYLAYNAIAKRATDENRPMSDEEVKAAVPDYTPGLSLRTVYWLQDHKLIPQAFSYGLTYAAGRGILRPSFLLGDYSDRGFWLYFPVAIATKTPLATLLLLVTSTLFVLIRRKTLLSSTESRWLALCLLSCPTIYLTFAVCSNLNIGVRHILPIYPMMTVAAGIALAKMIRSIRPARFVVPGLLALLLVETASAFPNYIAFFNRAAGGERGGLSILGDSNLDWGQDLPALSRFIQRWRAEHPDDAFYFAYFGSVDPRVYGIDFINMRPGFPYDERPATFDLDRDGLVAISATYLQGTFPEDLRPMMANLRAREPLAVVNGSIYVYEFKKPERASQ